MMVRLAIEAIEAPHLQISQAPAIWSALEPADVPPELSKLLHANGLRVGVCTEQGRPALIRALEQEGFRSFAQTIDVLSTEPTELLAPEQEARSFRMFLHCRDGSLVGQDYRQMLTALVVTPGIQADASQTVHLHVLPVIRSTRARVRTVRTPDGFDRVQQTEAQLLLELAMHVVLEEGQSLLIGPAPHAPDNLLVGTRFTIRDQTARPREMLYMLTPRLIRQY